jgi:hypothetical protein
MARSVTLRTLIIAVVLSAITGAATGLVANSFTVKRGPVGAEGPHGPAGEPGAVGSRGPRGFHGRSGAAAQVDDESVLEAVESDPSRVAFAVQDSLDPSPGDIARELSDLDSSFRELCDTLRFAQALTDVYISC